MTAVMKGVRVLEVADHTFVPAASALLADWGAEVVKVEHVERGDAMRGLAASGTVDLGDDVNVLLEHSNRGKQSIGIDLTSDEGLAILYDLVKTCDVFLTNKLPSVRAKLRIELDQIRAHNPDIIYVRGTGQGEHGPDADRGSYDSLAFWNRAGIATGQMMADDPDVVPPPPPGPAFGDSIGAMTIAGGMMGALYHRAVTGEATVVDVSLLGTGIWAMGAALALSLQFGVPWAPAGASAPSNPLTGNFRTSDGRFVSLICLQAARYWPEACEVVGRPELAHDPRFADTPSIMANAPLGHELLQEAFAEHTLAEWRERLSGFSGQWAVVQDTIEVASDPQTVANGYVSTCHTAGGTEFRLATAPVHYDGEPPRPARAPEFNEHCDAILEGLGLDIDTIIDLKVRGIIA
jgi:crotonobetainyl-CoA:carnitine CoA-transferase CaiB-like acyl-CoA transferase